MQSLLSIENLSVEFTTTAGTITATQGISLQVGRGEILAIVGESGSGKSVTSLSILQLLQSPPARYAGGKILFYDNGGEINLLQCPAKQLEQIRGNRIAMIFQEPMSSLNPVKTCGSQVSEALLLHKHITPRAAKQAALKLFEEVKLPNPGAIYNRYPHQLSGGQKQRVMIAMAMSCNPALLICDEPTTALDVTVQKSILHLIKKLQQQNNMGVIFISHDLGVVAEIADTVAVMYKGQIAEQGKCSDILNNPRHIYTKALLACRPALHSRGERLPVVSDFLNAGEKRADASRVLYDAGPQELPKEVTKTSPLLSVERLQVFYPAKTSFLGKVTAYTKAVNNVSFNVMRGEILGLVGESGCGKTTLGRAVLGLLKPQAGRIIFNGVDVTSASHQTWKALRKDMQIIFQDPFSSLNPRKTIGAAIAEPLKVHKIYSTKRQRKEKVIELLEKTGLAADHFNRYPHEFSGGQRQRIVIARALALAPSFIICDESVSALDVSVQAQVLNLLNDLKKTFGFTAIFISHDLSVIRYMSDRIAVMHNGAIEETGDTEALYNSPQTVYTKQLIESMPRLGR
ncbi:MAG TPA: ABC transporter ATP-binding protein [Chitinophagaceae bacterium]|nr:ABC transporter ATP-binding protein [Chitinophagaceae bacterium]